MKVLVLNGPNMARLGQRDPDLYGSTTLDELEQTLVAHGKERGVEVVCRQSDDVAELVAAIAGPGIDAIIINPAALTHHSGALRDAVGGCSVPVYEVHISNITAREPYRRRSLISPVARGTIMGLGVQGYLLALDAAIEQEA